MFVFVVFWPMREHLACTLVSLAPEQIEPQVWIHPNFALTRQAQTGNSPKANSRDGGSGPEPWSVAVRWVFGKAELRSAERDRPVPALSLVQLIQQVLVLAGGVGRRGVHGGGQDRRVSAELHGGRSLCAGRVCGGLAAALVLSVHPGPRLRPEHVAARPRWRPRTGHKVQGFGPFGSTAAPGGRGKHDVGVGEPGDLRVVFY